MTTPEKNMLTGVLLTGGKSSRMGTHKVLLSKGHQSFGLYLIHLLEEFCANVIVSQNETLIESEQRVVKDIYTDIGPLGGIHAALSASDTPWCLVVACDMPRIDAKVIQPLILNTEGCKAVCYEIDSFYEPLCALYHKAMLEDIEKAIQLGQYSLQKLLKSIERKTVLPGDDIHSLLQNINTPDDLNAYYIEQ